MFLKTFLCFYFALLTISQSVPHTAPKNVFKPILRTGSSQEPDEVPALQEHPGLRHHIAHFCPNLDVARTCIRKCMMEGKPAFCGKDHMCYCGHRYKNSDKNEKGDSNKIYEEFKDMYEKYFGPGASKKVSTGTLNTNETKSRRVYVMLLK